MDTSLLSAEEELYWLALRMVPGLGTRKTGSLIDRFRSPQAIFRASPSELEDAGLSGAVARSIASGCSFEEAAIQQQKLRQTGATLVTLADAAYPASLRGIFDPPPLLFARGNIDLLHDIMVGVVGTRRPSPYGIAAAERLSSDLAQAGVTIISGMARGIDTAAHRAALSVNGRTIAVLGCGVDIVYPSENRRLAAEIVAKGLIVSEFPMGSVAFPQNFPVRNRIISGSSYGLLVVEGAQYSGSAITARLALDQGREVFAVPGNITSKMSWGPNLLIKQGAKLVQDWNDVVVDLPPEARRRLIDAGRQRLLDQGFTEGLETSAAVPASISAVAGNVNTGTQLNRRIMEKLKVDAPTHLDALVESLVDCSPSELIAALFELEISGLAKQLPGKNFVKVW
ncbi:MAG TPA: DNA-processing protein DprA [Bryobacteraceae bacterium]